MTQQECLVRLGKAVATATDMAAKAQADNLVLQAIAGHLLADASSRNARPRESLLECLASLQGQVEGLVRQVPSSSIAQSLTETMLRISETAEAAMLTDTQQI